jgi:hypothetical protein
MQHAQMQIAQMPIAQMQKFTYLYRNSKNSDKPKKSIFIENLTKDQIISGFATKCENEFVYKFYPSYDTYRLNNSGYEHELIFGWQRQCLKFDIEHDCDLKEVSLHQKNILDEIFNNDKRPFIDIAMSKILDAICDAMYYTYEKCINRTDLIIIDSSGIKDYGMSNSSESKIGNTSHSIYRYSYNVIVYGYLVENNEEAKEFTKTVIESLPSDISKIIDSGVNKSTQLIRLVGQSKLPGPGEKRIKKIAPGLFGSKTDANDIDTVISPRTNTMHGNHDFHENHRNVSSRSKLILLPAKLGIIKPNKTKTIEIINQNIREILNLDSIVGLIKSFRYRTYHDNMIIFDRIESSHCRICDRIHHKDNTLTLSIAQNGIIYEKCRRSPDKSLFAGEYPLFQEIHSQSKCTRSTDESKQDATTERKNQSSSKERKRNTKSKPEKSSSTLPNHVSQTPKTGIPVKGIPVKGMWFSDFIKSLKRNTTKIENGIRYYSPENTIVYNEPNMRDYPLTETLFVRAQMKLGKTKTLKKYMNEYFPHSAANPVIRIVTFRQTFSNSIKSSFPDFTMYNTITGIINQFRVPRLIIQVESLHRLEMRAPMQPIQLLVLDEVESILEQFNSGLHKNFSASFAVFEWMIRTCEHLICMDANLSQRSFEIIKMIRNRSTNPHESPTGLERSSPVIHLNMFKRAANDIFKFTLSKGAIIAKITEYVAKDKRIVITTNSLSDAKTIYHDLTTRFKKKQIQIYSSKTSQSEKKTHFSDVSTHWSKLDILIYTPTVSAGISFELEHFDALFGLFTDKSCSVEVCRQMLLRVRNLRENAYYIYLNGTFKNLPTDIDEIRKTILSSRRSLYSMDIPMAFSYDDDGAVHGINTNTPFFRLWLENTRIKNISRNNFIREFIQQVFDTGATVSILETETNSLADFKEAKKNMISIACTEIAQAQNIDHQEAAEIIKEITSDSGNEIPKSKLLSYEKYKLADSYGKPINEINSNFVELYNHKYVKNIYHNLQKIHAAPDIWSAVENVRQRELDQRDAIWSLYSSDVALHQDIQYRYTTNRHRLAIMLLTACGFRCLTDKLVLYDKALFANLDAFQLYNYIKTIKTEFELSTNYSIDKPGNRLKIVNAILRLMYGMEIKKFAKCNYSLKNTTTGDLFQIISITQVNSVKIDKPKIISKLILDTTSDIDVIISVIYTHFYQNLDEENK